jgi:hypothetical protein
MAIYYLDIDDEVTSAAARIRDSSDTRIALVLVGGSRVATSRINFRLLAREAKSRHKRLAIVAPDATVQSVARSANLPVYTTVGEYEKAEAARAAGLANGTTTEIGDALDELALTVGPGAAAARAQKPSRVAGASGSGRVGGLMPRVSRAAVAGVAAVVVLVLAASAFFFYPSATVVVTLREESLGPVTVSVKVDPSASVANDQASIVPGASKQFAVTADGKFDATGERIDETAATGTVTFTSEDTGSDWAIPAGTQITTADGVAFTTNARVVVPHAVFSPPTRGTVNAAITAVKKGTAGNVAAGAITQMPNVSGNGLLSVTNGSPTTGGTHTVTPQIQQTDIDQAARDMYSRLDSAFKAALGGQNAAPSGSTILEASARLGAATCDPDPAALVGTDGATFDLACRGTGTVTLVEMAAVRQLAERRIGSGVKPGYSLVTGSVSSVFGTPIVQGSSVVVPVTITARQVRTVDADEIRAGVKGKSLDEARAFAETYGIAEISVSPGWASTMPSFDFRIDVQLVVPGAPGPSPSVSASAKPTRTGEGSVPVKTPPSSGAGSSSARPSVGPTTSPAQTPVPTGSPAATPSPS